MGRSSRMFVIVFGIEFFATIFSEHHLELVNAIGASTVKIASSDINHIPLIVKAAQTGMSVQLDTGNASYDEIAFAIKKLRNRAIIRSLFTIVPLVILHTLIMYNFPKSKAKETFSLSNCFFRSYSGLAYEYCCFVHGSRYDRKNNNT